MKVSLLSVALLSLVSWTAAEPIHVPSVDTESVVRSLAKQSLFKRQSEGHAYDDSFVDSLPSNESSVASLANFTASDVSDWFANQVPYALDRMLKNIHPVGTLPGTVIASTSRSNPPYFYHWVRDSALTMDVIVTLYKEASDPSTASRYEQLLWDYARLSRRHQAEQGCNPYIKDLCEAQGGPAEPKYEVNGEVFKGGWGRLQTDGPPLRASTLIRFALAYLEKGGSIDRVKLELYDGKLPSNSVVKIDLEYAAHHWGDRTFDLWEEVPATHFFTRMVTRRALLEGAAFANKMGDGGAAKWYEQQAKAIQTALDSHWDSGSGYIREMIATPDWYNRQGRNVGTVLAVIHGYADDGVYSPVNDKVQASVVKLLQDFERIYDVNKVRANEKSQPLGVAVGRYQEDKYDGTQGNTSNTQGHPWYLATLAVAELYYKMIETYKKDGFVQVTSTSSPFFAYIGLNQLKTGQRYDASSPSFTQVIETLGQAAESLVRRVVFHLKGSKDMSEQYSRFNGSPLSAEHLTWSYASVLTAYHARQEAQ